MWLPIVAINHAYDVQAQTVRDWLESAVLHAEALHHDQVLQPRDVGQGHADEVRVKTQCGIVWMAMMVSTRLWLGSVINTRRDQRLITRLVALIATCAIVAPVLVVVDGFRSYVDAVRLDLPLISPLSQLQLMVQRVVILDLVGGRHCFKLSATETWQRSWLVAKNSVQLLGLT